MPTGLGGEDWGKAIVEGLYGPTLRAQEQLNLQQMALQNWMNEQAVKQQFMKQQEQSMIQQITPAWEEMAGLYEQKGDTKTAQHILMGLKSLQAGGLEGFEQSQKLIPKEEKPAKSQFVAIDENGNPLAYDPNTNSLIPVTTTGKVFPKSGETSSFERDLTKESTNLIKSGQLKKQDVFSWKQNQRNIAAGQKAAVIQEQKPIGEAAGAALAGLDVMTTNLNNVDKLYKQSKLDKLQFTGPIRGRLGTIGEKYTGNISPEEVEFRTTLADLQDSLLRARSGAQINEQEYKRLKRFLPDYIDPSNVFETKLKRFNEETKAIKQSRLKFAVTPKGQLKQSVQQPVASVISRSPALIEDLNPEDVLKRGKK